MAKVKGICTSVDSGCEKAKTREIQEVDKTNPVCGECGRKLKLVTQKPKGGDSSMGKWIGIAAVAVVLIGGGIYLGVSGDKSKAPVEGPVPPVSSGTGAGTSTTVDSGAGTTEGTNTGDEIPETDGETAKSEDKWKLDYATYEGDRNADGKAHGNGTLYFTKKHVIPGTKDCEAEAGEKVIGTFRDGKINMGTWYRKDGNEIVIKYGQKLKK